jgi:prepilin peptidase CpaA
MSVPSHEVALWVVAVACVIAAILDAWKFRVPNKLSFALLGSGLVFHACVGGGPGLGTSLLGAACGFGALIGVYAVGGMGAGDVKLGAAVGAWLGASTTFHVLLAASLAGGAYALVLILAGRVAGLLGIGTARRVSIRAARRGEAGSVSDALLKPDRRLRLVPFGAMIAVGVAAVGFGF